MRKGEDLTFVGNIFYAFHLRISLEVIREQNSSYYEDQGVSLVAPFSNKTKESKIEGRRRKA